MLTSCLGAKKAGMRKVAATAAAIQAADEAKLANISGEKNEKLESGKIDSTIFANINAKLVTYRKLQDSVTTAINQIQLAASNKKVFRKSLGELEEKKLFLQAFIDSAGIRLRRFNLISDGLDVAEQHEFDLAAFFGPGKYKIPEDKIDIAHKSFAPIVDSLINFYNKYPDLDKTATLIILGFADGQGFSEESEFYQEMSAQNAGAAVPKEFLNMRLSALRAEELGNTMEIVLKRNIDKYEERKTDFSFVEKGKGENFPNAKITNYSEVDERRRIVLLYWNILPKN